MGHWHETRMAYDSQGRLSAWQRNVLKELYQYDDAGRLTEIRLTNDSIWRFGYHSSNLVGC